MLNSKVFPEKEFNIVNNFFAYYKNTTLQLYHIQNKMSSQINLNILFYYINATQKLCECDCK